MTCTGTGLRGREGERRREGRKQGGTPGRAGPGSLAPGVARQAGEEEVLS